MIPKIFEIDSATDSIIINDNILSIPELRQVYDFYAEDPDTRFNAFQFLRHYCDPYGAYNQLSEADKEETLFADFPGEYSLEDDCMIGAIKKLKSLYMSPKYQYYLDNKELLYRLGTYARTATISDGKNGNLADLINQISKAGKLIVEFDILEKQAEKELQKMKIRGNRHIAYDEFDEND